MIFAKVNDFAARVNWALQDGWIGKQLTLLGSACAEYDLFRGILAAMDLQSWL